MLRDKRSDIQILTEEDLETWAMTPKSCPRCEHHEMRHRDVQLRGADEGSIIFHKCPTCGYRYVEAEGDFTFVF